MNGCDPEDLIEAPDPLTKLRADIDQAVSTFRESSRLVRGHFTALVEAGFTETQALSMTRDYHRALLCTTTSDHA